MRVLLTTVGSSGDVHPFVALGCALRDAGHEPLMVVNPHFGSTVEGAGLEWIALGEEVSPADIIRDHPRAFSATWGAWVLARKVFAPHIVEGAQRLMDAARSFRPDVVVGHQISFGAPWAARAVGARWATCSLAPSTLFSVDDPSVYPPGRDTTWWPRPARVAGMWAGRRVVNFVFDPVVARARRATGQPRRGDTFWGEMLEADALLGLFSPRLRGPAPDDPPTLRICGFPWFERHGAYGDRAERLDDRLERFLGAGDPPVVVALGTVLAHTAERLFDRAIAACRAVGRRAVLVTGHDHAGRFGGAPDLCAIDYAPYSQLFPRGVATLFHGGVGTTAQAMRAGRPMVVLPHAHDQFDNGARVARLGIGASIAERRATTRRLASALDSIIGDAGYAERAASMGRAIASEDGAAEAARVIADL